MPRNRGHRHRPSVATIVADAVRVREAGTVQRTTHNKVGNVTQTVDGLGNETISLFDRRGRLTSVYEPLRDPSVTPWRPTPVDNPTGTDWTTVSDSRALWRQLPARQRQLQLLPDVQPGGAVAELLSDAGGDGDVDAG